MESNLNLLYRFRIPYKKCLGPVLLQILKFVIVCCLFLILEHLHIQNEIILRMEPKSNNEIHLCFTHTLYIQPKGDFICLQCT